MEHYGWHGSLSLAMIPASALIDSDDALLASLGYKQEFKRAFTRLGIFGVAFTNIGLLPSVASVLSSSISNGGAVSMVWGWVFGSFFILCIGIAIGELASSAPTAGGLYYLTYSLAPPWCRNILCWIVGYASTIGYIAGIASVDWGCAVQIAAAVAIGTNGQLVLTTSQTYGIYVAIIVSQGIICSFGTKALARLQKVSISVNVLLCLVVIISLPIATSKESMNSASYVFGDFTNVSGWPDVFAFILGLLAPLWTICCYDAVIHISEESCNPAVSIPFGIVSTIVVAGILGFAINIVLAFCMGSNLSAVLGSSVGQPMAQIFLNSFGQTWTLVIWSFVILAQYMMGASAVLVSSRQSFAFARDGALPFSNLLYRVNAHTGTPVNTVWFDCMLAILVGLLSLSGAQAVTAVFMISVISLYIAYIIPIVSRFVFDNNFKPGPFSLGALSAPIAMIAVVFMIFIFVIFCFPSSPGPQVATMNFTAVVFGGVMLLAMAWYYLPVYGAARRFHGPASNVERKTESVGFGEFDSDQKEV